MSRTVAGRAQHATVGDLPGGTCDLCGNAPTAPGTPLHDEDHEGIGVTTFYGFRESVMERVMDMTRCAGPGTPYRVLNDALALIEDAADLVRADVHRQESGGAPMDAQALAVNAFLSVFRESEGLLDLSLTCGEADAFAALLTELGAPDLADDLIDAHSFTDVAASYDQHCRGEEAEKLAAMQAEGA